MSYKLQSFNGIYLICFHNLISLTSVATRMIYQMGKFYRLVFTGGSSEGGSWRVPPWKFAVLWHSPFKYRIRIHHASMSSTLTYESPAKHYTCSSCHPLAEMYSIWPMQYNMFCVIILSVCCSHLTVDNFVVQCYWLELATLFFIEF